MKVVPRYNLLYEEFLGGESLAQGASLGACPGDVHDGEGGQGRGDLVPHVSEGVGPVLPQNVVCPGGGVMHTGQLSIGGKNGEIEGKIEGNIFINRGQL